MRFNARTQGLAVRGDYGAGMVVREVTSSQMNPREHCKLILSLAKIFSPIYLTPLPLMEAISTHGRGAARGRRAVQASLGWAGKSEDGHRARG